MRFTRWLRRHNLKKREKEIKHDAADKSKRGWSEIEGETSIKEKSAEGLDSQRHVPAGKGHHMARSMKGHT